MKPRDARTVDEILQLERDNADTGDFWIILDDEGDSVTIAEQPRGEELKTKVTMPRQVFNVLVDWYNTGEGGEPAPMMLHPRPVVITNVVRSSTEGDCDGVSG